MERERDSWSRLRPLAWLLYADLLPLLCCGSSGSVRLVIRRSQVRFPAGSLWIFLSLSKSYIVNNSLHKTCMLYRIVYTKLSVTVVYCTCGICGINWIYYHSHRINTICSTRLFTFGCTSRVNRLAEYILAL